MAYEVLYLQTGETPARLDRWWIDRVFSEGVSDVQAGDLAVSERAGAANLSVDVAPGAAIVDGDDTTDQGAYLVRLTAGVNVPIAAPPAADSRIDLVVLRVADSTATGTGDATTDGAVVEVVEGVAAAAPVAPAVPATAIALAEVTVAAGDAAITAAEILDRRAQLNAETLDVGTQAIPLTTVERDALNAPKVGTLVWNTDTGTLERYDGATWVPDAEIPPGNGRVVTGSYTGNNTTGRKILTGAGFQSAIVTRDGTGGYGGAFGVYVVGGHGVEQSVSNTVHTAAVADTDGFYVGGGYNAAGNFCNDSGQVYHWTAILAD